ncbi:MAG: hypothetical protein ACKOBN_09220 [Flavobacteriales bacterium]
MATKLMTKHQILLRFFSILFLAGSLQLKAQEIKPDDSFTFELCLPNAVGNKPFELIMQGLVHANLHYQYAFKSGFYLGAGTHYSYFAINEFRVPTKVYGGIHSAAAFFKTGHEKFWSERIGTDMGIRIGQVLSFSVSDALATQGLSPKKITSYYIEPNISFILTSDVNQSFRLSVGLPIYGFTFDPQLIGLEGDFGYGPEEFRKNSTYLSVGFGYTYYLNGKKSTTPGFDD